MPNDEKSAVVKSGGTFSGTAKHRRTTVVSMTSKSSKDVVVKKRGRCVPRNLKAPPGARKVKYEPSIESDNESEEEEDERPVCFAFCCHAKVDEKMVKSTLHPFMCDVSKCCKCDERKCPDCEWSVQCATYKEHGFCRDCKDTADLCEDCGSCSECRPGGDYCCKSYLFKHKDRDSDDDSCYRWLNGKRRLR